MKKYLSIVLALLFVAGLSSCTKKYVTPNNTNTNTTVYRNVSPNSWVLDQAEGAYKVELSVPELDAQYNDDGAVLVYMAFNKGVYEQLPEVYQGASFSYYHSVGKVVIYSQTPGGAPATPPNQTVTVKIVMIDSNVL